MFSESSDRDTTNDSVHKGTYAPQIEKIKDFEYAKPLCGR